MITSKQVTITTTPTAIFGPDQDGAFLVLNVVSDGNVNIYLGNASVTTFTGLEVNKNDQPFAIQVGPGEILYGIVASTSGVISYLATLNQ